MIISHSRRFIFVHVHKAGGTSMEIALAKHLAWNDLILGSTELGQAMNTPYKHAHGLFDHCSVEEIARVCGADIFGAFFSFALVRHPVDRLVSMYNFIYSLIEFAHRRTGLDHHELCRRILEGDLDEERPFMTWPVTRGYAESEGFAGFIRSETARPDRAFMSQSEQLQTADGGLSVRMAIRLDELRTRLPALQEQLGIPLDIPHLNRAQFVAQRPSEVGPGDRAYIRELYSDDYLAFEFA